MVVVQFRISAQKKDKKAQIHSELDLLKREDANELEFELAKVVQQACLAYLKDLESSGLAETVTKIIG